MADEFHSYLEKEGDGRYYKMNTLGYYYEELNKKKKELDSLIEQVKAGDAVIVERLEEVDKELTDQFGKMDKALVDRLIEWDGKIESFPDDVTTLLGEWAVDGTLDTVVQTALIDEKIEPLSTQLADKANASALPISLASRGFNANKTAAENTAIAKQAILDAEATGRALVFPWVLPTQYIDIDEPLQILTGGIRLEGFGKPTRIRQTAFPAPVFELQQPNVEIEGFNLFSLQQDISGLGSQQKNGHLLLNYHSGVISYTDDIKINNVSITDFAAGVLFHAWDFTLNSESPALKRGKVTNVEVDNVMFGLLCKGVEDFHFDDIKGNYNIRNAGVPPHLVYFVDSVNENKNVIGGNCFAYDGLDSFAYQFKGMNGSILSNLQARACLGTLNLMTSKNVQLSKINHLNDKHVHQIVGSIELQGVNDNINIDGVFIQMDTDGKAIRYLSEASNSVLRNAKVQSNHANPESVAYSYDVDIQGTNNIAENVDVKNVGIEPWSASIGIWGGTNNTLSNPSTAGNKAGVVIRSGNNHTLKNYDINNLKKVGSGAGGTPYVLIVPAKLQEIQPVETGDREKVIAFDKAKYSGSTSNQTLNFTSSGQSWIQALGTWRQDNGRIFSEGAAPSLAYIDAGTANIDFSVGVKYKDREAIAFRVVGNTTFLFTRLNRANSSLELYKRVSGTATLLTSIVLDFLPQLNRRYRMGVKVFENRVDVFVDGDKLLTHELSADDMTTFGNSTLHGLSANVNPSGFYDNPEWRSLE